MGTTAFVACSGAVSDYIIDSMNYGNMELPQAITVNGYTRVVTISIGGNDVGFGSILSICSHPTWTNEEAQCLTAIASGSIIATSAALKNKLSSLYASIRTLGDVDMQVIVLGYPNIFPEFENIVGSCVWGNGVPETSGRSVSADEVDMARLLHDQLNSTIASAVSSLDDEHVHFIDPTPAFVSHELCTSEPWVNGVIVQVSTAPIAGSYHPTQHGQQAFASLIKAKLEEIS